MKNGFKRTHFLNTSEIPPISPKTLKDSTVYLSMLNIISFDSKLFESQIKAADRNIQIVQQFDSNHFLAKIRSMTFIESTRLRTEKSAVGRKQWPRMKCLLKITEISSSIKVNLFGKSNNLAEAHFQIVFLFPDLFSVTESVRLTGKVPCKLSAKV